MGAQIVAQRGPRDERPEEFTLRSSREQLEDVMAAVLEREASKLFSTAVFRDVATGRSTQRADAAASRLRGGLGLEGDVTNREIVEVAYDLLRRGYRSEYFYRNLLTSKVFVGRHRAARSVLLNEFRIGESVADCVLVNGRGAVYEIKTEFDSPEKLRTQLTSYYQAFPFATVVAHMDDADRYLRLIDDGPVGLIAVGPRDRLSVIKEASPKTDAFNVRTMFNALRLSEVTRILQTEFGALPVVPNGLRYAAYLDLAEQMNPDLFQARMQSALKTRQLRNSRQLMLTTSLIPLRAVVAQLDPDDQQQERLLSWLSARGA